VLLRKHGEADQMHTPGAMPDLRLLPWLDQARGNDARLVVGGAKTANLVLLRKPSDTGGEISKMRKQFDLRAR